MSKTSKIPFSHLLIKIDQVKYRTPCGSYTIEYSNFGYIDEINWTARLENGIYFTYADTLSDLMINLIKEDEFLGTKLYAILYEIEIE